MGSTENTYLGRDTRGGINVWKAKHIEYILGTLAAVTLKLSISIINLPNLPTGESIASNSPPT